jgi:RNA polymerase sigma-70 factor (ECF subfamily)
VISSHDSAIDFACPPALGRRSEERPVTTPASADFRSIYDGHFNFVWCSLRRLGVRESDVMDLTQKVFLIVNQKLSTFEGRSQLATWLFGICQRVASDYRRSALIRCEVVTDSAELDLRADEGDGLVEKGESRRRAEVAESILNRLPEPQRVVFVLFELEEMSGDDIAALLDVPVGTVRSRLRLARETFRREVRRLTAAGSVPRKEAV